MGAFQAAALAVIGALLALVVREKNPALAVPLAALACCGIFLVSLRMLEPVVDMAQRLRVLSGTDDNLTGILLKEVGIGLITELAVSICEDAGQGALGKAAQFAGSAAAVALAVPLLDKVLGLLTELLGIS